MATAQQPAGMSLTRQKVGDILLADESKKYITPLLPHGITLERIMPEVHRAVYKNPAILDCTPTSIIMAVGDTLRWDLAIGETVHLVPFREKVSTNPDRYEKRLQAIRDYKGDIELVVRSGAARGITAHNVYANEPFKYHQGDDPSIEHEPILDPAKRGEFLGSYAIARLSFYQKKIVWLHATEIEAVRQAHSKQWKLGPIPEWYGPKTCVHRVTKEIPKNPKLAGVLRAFALEEEEIPEGEFEVVGTETAAGANAEPPVQATASPEVAPAPAAPSAPEPKTSSGKPVVPDDRLPTEEQVARLLELAANEAVDAEIKERVEIRLAECTIDSQTAKLWIGLLEEKVSQSAASQELFARAVS